jgi:hypothetical protein
MQSSKVGRPKKDVHSVQLRFSVPSEDTIVLDWIKKQYNASSSIRALVKAAIAKYGYKDCTCIPEITEASVSKQAYTTETLTSMPVINTPQVQAQVQPQISVEQSAAYAVPPQPVSVQSVPQQVYQQPLVQSPGQPVQPQYPQEQSVDGADTLASLLS